MCPEYQFSSITSQTWYSMWKKTAGFLKKKGISTNSHVSKCWLTFQTQSTFSAPADKQNQSVTVNHHHQLYIVSLDTGCHVMKLIWILQHACCPQMLCYTLSLVFLTCKITIWRKWLIINLIHNKRYIQQASMPTFLCSTHSKIFLLCRCSAF